MFLVGYIKSPVTSPQWGPWLKCTHVLIFVTNNHGPRPVATCCVCYLTIRPFGVLWPSSLTSTWMTLLSSVRGQGPFWHVYEDSQGSRAVFVCLVTRKETRDRIPVINERRDVSWKEGLSGSLQNVLIRLCFRGVNGFVGHSPCRSAEVVAAPHCRRVAANVVFNLLVIIYLE